MTGQVTSDKHVFISHAIEDIDFAQRLAGDLKRLGAQVWIAPHRILPGESWLEAIERGLGESSHVVIVLTPAALEASGYVPRRRGVPSEELPAVPIQPTDFLNCPSM